NGYISGLYEGEKNQKTIPMLASRALRTRSIKTSRTPAINLTFPLLTDSLALSAVCPSSPALRQMDIPFMTNPTPASLASDRTAFAAPAAAPNV
ncbi:hypothetical protein AZZ66_004683, partial [Escherichia coli]